MNLISSEFYSIEEAAASGDTGGQVALERTTARDFAAFEFELAWQSAQVSHTDIYIASRINLWRDYYPPELEPALVDLPIGRRTTLHFPPGSLVPNQATNLCRRLEPDRFERRVINGHSLEPHTGRFYPKGLIAGVRDVTSEDITPFRIAYLDDEQMLADLNHPLAGTPLTLTTTVLKAWQAGAQRGGVAQDLPDLIIGHGPGMQARWRGQPTDFFSQDAFQRQRNDPDAAFYSQPRLVEHLDRVATHQLEKLYARLLPAGARVLDLMASWRSHLSLAQPATVSGLGLNAEELAANPILNERTVADLNHDPALPYSDAEFDAVICTVSVEYLIRPMEVFAEVKRVLKPGGRFILVFSNRYFPPKAVQVWIGAHPFERAGLVLEYFLRTGGFDTLNSFSLTGLSRPEDDKYAAQTPWSDPVHAVWGAKT